MNIAADIAFVEKLIEAGASPTKVGALVTAIQGFMQVAEASGEDGAAKLQAVEQKAQVFMATFLPEAEVKWDALAADARDLINLLVSAYNAAKGWFADVEHFFGVKR